MQTKRILNLVKFFLILVFLMLLFHKAILKAYFVLDYREQILFFSQESKLNPELVSAIVFVESRFNPRAESRKGALGLMQIMPETGKWIAGKLNWTHYQQSDLLEPKKNLALGTWYLAYLKEVFHQNENIALASYNAGLNSVSGWLKKGIWNGETVRLEQIPFPETRNYLLRIIILKNLYQYLYPELAVSVRKERKNFFEISSYLVRLCQKFGGYGNYVRTACDKLLEINPGF